jgi:hypothetical protein
MHAVSQVFMVSLGKVSLYLNGQATFKEPAYRYVIFPAALLILKPSRKQLNTKYCWQV